jgi:putative phosphoesterase
MTQRIRIGLISDTHGLLRPAALEWLRGSDRVLHAGDICDPSVLATLDAIAPTTAVLGNNDVGRFAGSLEASVTVEVGGIRIHMTHDISQLSVDLHEERIDVVVYGHSHKPRIEDRDGVLFVNPGSAGPRRFKLPVSAGELIVDGTTVRANLFEIAV